MTALLALMQPWFAPAFTAWGIPFTWLEIVAVALSIAMVVCNMRVNPLGWPLTIVASLLYFALFWNSKLYGDASLQLFFVVIAAWGWWQWLRGTTANGAALQVQTLSRQGRVKALVVVLISWPAIGWFLKNYTDTDVPWWDAFPTAASIVGQWLLARKYLENWATWVVVNIVSVALFAYKGLWLTTALYVAFVLMSVAGWRAWQRLLAAPKTQ
jgi:nicotinamide mononucleotide transporter